MIFFELIATFFSKVKAPPPPLIPSRLSSTRSAPSTVKSAWSISANSSTLKPKPSSCFLLRLEVVTICLRLKPSFSLRSPNASIKKATVDPVPTP